MCIFKRCSLSSCLDSVQAVTIMWNDSEMGLLLICNYIFYHQILLFAIFYNANNHASDFRNFLCSQTNEGWKSGHSQETLMPG